MNFNVRMTLGDWKSNGGCGLSHLTEGGLCRQFRSNVNGLEAMPLLTLFREGGWAGRVALREIRRFRREHLKP